MFVSTLCIIIFNKIWGGINKRKCCGDNGITICIFTEVKNIDQLVDYKYFYR